jgi:DNA-binding CsgD family transcriptional regulator
VTDLSLTEAEQRRVRRLLRLEAASGDRERWCAALLAMSQIIPCDWTGISVVDATGCVEYGVNLPDDAFEDLGPQVCDGPLPIGIQHVAAFPDSDEDRMFLASWGIRDTLRLGFPLEGGRAVQMYLDRKTAYFGERDLAMLAMLEPALERLMRPSPRIDGLGQLSVAEHRVLELVARGGSNGDVASQLMVSEATVRKHLEHTYRKLGVANRTAAAALVRVGAGG